MKNICLVILLFISEISFCQNSKVDQRNGFKHLKLGMSYSSFNDLEVVPNDDPNKRFCVWKPNDSNLRDMFGYKVDLFELTFDKREEELVALSAVHFIEKPINDPIVFKQYEDILNHLVIALGNPDTMDDKTLTCRWAGRSVVMSFSIEMEQVDSDGNGGLVGLTSLKLTVFNYDKMMQIINGGF